MVDQNAVSHAVNAVEGASERVKRTSMHDSALESTKQVSPVERNIEAMEGRDHWRHHRFIPARWSCRCGAAIAMQICAV
jgi:hypothetical protein